MADSHLCNEVSLHDELLQSRTGGRYYAQSYVETQVNRTGIAYLCSFVASDTGVDTNDLSSNLPW